MTVKRLLIGIVLIAVIGGGAYYGYQQWQANQETEEAAATVDADSLRVDTGIDLVTAEGRVIPLQETNLSSQTTGAVVEILVTEGDMVEAGDPLLRLATTDQEIAITQAEVGITQAEANIETAQVGLLLAQLNLEAANLAVRAAEADLALLEAGPTDAQVALSEQNVAVAEAGINQAGANQNLTLEGATSAQIAAAQAQLSAMQAAYDNALKSYQPVLQNPDSDEEAREQAGYRLNSASESLNAAQAALDSLLTGASNSERTAASSGVAVAANQRDAAQAQVDLLLAGTRPEQIAIAEASLQQTQDAVTEAELGVTNAETAVTQAEAALSEAEAALALAENALTKRTLTAPFAGTIADVHAKVGEIAQAGLPVITLADFSQWQVETTDLTELNVVEVSRDLPVSVQIDAFPGEEISGWVTDISEVSNNVLGDVTYIVTVALEDDNNLPLRWGMTAVVDVDTEK
ncbi:MAG: HlyD family efflux transporter periplasmic adaptor subunit [Chloroflexi bacterium]|nr:HlyD family efflux transporter periplasmic adaptor subunit [Chloroflexota bacterium]